MPSYHQPDLLELDEFQETEVSNYRQLPSVFRQPAYEETLRAHPVYQRYLDGKEIDPQDLSLAILDALDAALPPKAGIIVNSSTGKDSSLLSAIVATWLASLKDASRELRPVLVAISDTGSEFPEMRTRMQLEAQRITDYALRQGLPMRAEITMPPPKHRLLVEVIGNGKPLPMQKNGRNLSGRDKAAGWCMDRVKAGPLDAIANKAKAEFPFYAQLLGTRSTESARRSANIAHASEGFPFGLTAIGSSKGGVDDHRVGAMPIVHWTNNEVARWFKTEMAPWDIKSNPELRNIYAKGAGDTSETTECSITITQEGSVTSACSDLSGTRMGCWMCMLSKNKSLANTAQRDTRYIWLRNFHSYLHGHHRRHDLHIQRRKDSGFAKETLFRKTYLFSERYFMLMLLFRAELESGFTLLQPEELEMIEEYWRKSGVWNITTRDARQDTRRWKATGKPIMSFQRNSASMEYLSHTLGEGIPSGAFWVPAKDKGLHHPLELVHLAALAGGHVGSCPTPKLTSYVMADRRKTDKFIVMVTDTPSVIGTKTNTGLLNGLIGAAWECVGSRPPTSWEVEMADGRSYFYATSVGMSSEEVDLLVAKYETSNPQERKRAIDATERQYQNITTLTHREPDWWEKSLMKEMDISDLGHRFTPAQFARHYHLVADAVHLSEHLNYTINKKVRLVREQVKLTIDLLETDTPEAKKARQKLRLLTKTELNLADLQAAFRSHSRLMRILAIGINRQILNAPLVEKFAYLARLEPVDPEDWRREFTKLGLRVCKPPCPP